VNALALGLERAWDPETVWPWVHDWAARLAYALVVMRALRSWARPRVRLTAEDLEHSSASAKAAWSWAAMMAHLLVRLKDEKWGNAWGQMKESAKGKAWGPSKVKARAWHLVRHTPGRWGKASAKVAVHEWVRAWEYEWASE